MDLFIAPANIKHYKELLRTNAPVERVRVLKLLAEEEEKLKIAEANHRAQDEKDRG
jgi:hypothetical protein